MVATHTGKLEGMGEPGNFDPTRKVRGFNQNCWKNWEILGNLCAGIGKLVRILIGKSNTKVKEIYQPEKEGTILTEHWQNIGGEF